MKYLNVFRQGGGFLDKSTRVVSSDSVWSWNDASGITVGVLDSGIIWNHPHFSGPDRVYGTSDDNVVIYSGQDFIDGGSPEAQCHPDDPYWCAGAHGVRTASVISGTGNFQGRLIQGNSYKASLTIVRILDSASYLYNNMESDGPWLSALDPDNDNNLWEDNSSDVLSNSWGEPDWGQYTELARQADRVVFGELGRPVLAIQATGNWYNLVGVPASAKNVLAVGASADYRSSNNACGDGFGQADPNNLYVMNYSNRGTVDGRVKPDLLAPGSDITMANMSGDYRSDDGTSFAAPHVSAAAAQILKTFGNISPAMLKTFLIARAVGGGTTNSPNINQGWGRLNALRPHGIFADDFHYSYRDGILNNNDPNVPATVSWPISIPSGTNLLAVTMAYTDKPADVPVNQALVRKIDLYLIYPNSTKIFQNDDNVNNVEKYVILNPVAGEWRAVLNVTRVEGFWGVGKNTSYGIVFNVIKPSRTPRINVQLTPSTFQPPVGVPFTLYADVTSEGLTSYDIWADLDIPSGISLLSLPLDGMDADKDIIGDLVADALRQSKQWSLRGDTPGVKTITVHVRGKWVTGDSFDEVKTIIVDVGGTNCDYDGDGHESLQCGGDDCNDNNANVYPGHVEWCDGIDNDCDNDIDEGCGGIVCYDWTDNNVPPQYYISSVSYGPYCASGRDWEFADIDYDGRNEHYMLVGETYAIWGRCEAKPGHTVLDFLNQDGTIHYGCADGACNEQIENFYYSRTYTEPAVVYPISYPDMFCWASGATNTWGWPGYILYDDYGGYTEGYLVVYCGMDADCPVGQYCSKPYLGNPASFYCAPNTAPTVIDLTQYPTSLYRGQSIEIRCKVSDAETQPQNLEVTIEYQRGGETGWNSCADTWDAGNQWWECTKQTEFDDVALGLWDFRCKVSDGTTESQWTIDVDTVTVMNNIPYFAALPSQQISEDTPGSQIYLDLWSYSSDIEDNNVVLSYSIDSQSNPALINCFITQQRFFTCNNPAPESSGTSLINIRVADSDNGFNVSSVVVNITAVNDAPLVMLIYPPNNYYHEGTDAVNFIYNVNDVDSSALANCSLYIDSQLRQTEYSPPMNTELVFSEYIAVGTHTWYIGCTDNEGTLGTSEVRNILYFNLSGFNYSSQYFVYNISDNFSSLIVRANLPTYSWIDEGKLQPDCSDLRIVNSGYNMTLPFEIENNTCNNAEFNATVWHTGEIRANQNNTFYVFYGSSNAQSENNNPTPWNDPNLIAVWHLSDNRTDGASDSGKYSHDLRVFAGTTPPETVNGVFGYGTNLSMSSAGNHYPAATDKFYLSEDITPFDPSNTAGNWTVSAWFKVIQFPTYGYPATLIAKSQTRQGHPAFALYLQANRAIGFAIEKNPCIGQAPANGAGEITPGVWHYAVGKYNGTHVSVYLDGQLNASTAWSGGMATCANHPQYFPGPVSILCWYFNTNICAASHGENIQFDEIQIYNRSVVDKEIIAEWSMKSALKANEVPIVLNLTEEPSFLYRGQDIEIQCKVTDPDTPAQNLNVTIEYQRGSEAGWNACTETWDAANQWWECTKTAELTDNALGYWDFRCKVSDGTSESQWTIDVDTVSVLNNNPYFLETLPAQQLPEDGNGSQIYLELLLYSEDIEDGDPALSHSIESQSNPALIDCFISQQQFFTCSDPAPESSGTSLINISVADSDNGSNVSSVVVNVTAVNDAPIVSLISPEDDHIERNTKNITFVYIPTDIDSSIQQCSLNIGNETSYTMSFYTNWSSEQGRNGIYYKYHDQAGTWYDMEYSQSEDKWYAPNNPQSRFWREAYQNIMFHPGTQPGQAYPYPALWWVVQSPGTYKLDGYVSWNFQNGGDGFDVNITINGVKKTSYYVHTEMPIPINASLGNLSTGDIVAIIIESRLNSDYDWGKFTNMTIKGAPTANDTEIENNVQNIFTKILENGNYIWNIACFDGEEYGYSENRDLWINIHHGGGKSLPYEQYGSEEI